MSSLALHHAVHADVLSCYHGKQLPGCSQYRVAASMASQNTLSIFRGEKSNSCFKEQQCVQFIYCTYYYFGAKLELNFLKTNLTIFTLFSQKIVFTKKITCNSSEHLLTMHSICFASPSKCCTPNL